VPLRRGQSTLVSGDRIRDLRPVREPDQRDLAAAVATREPQRPREGERRAGVVHRLREAHRREVGDIVIATRQRPPAIDTPDVDVVRREVRREPARR
jgi:hypothetical protein